MKRLTSIIRCDAEFEKYLRALTDSLAAEETLPIAVNGLSGGAETSFIVESAILASKTSGAPSVILCESEGARERIYKALLDAEAPAIRYKRRDLIFHNIRASHDVDRERLSVLSDASRGEPVIIVTSPSAAMSYTMPEELLGKLSVTAAVGDVIPPAEMAAKLSDMGFARVDTVDGRGQFSTRGGILDFWSGETEAPIRVEFFGDEIDRIAYFDPISQRAVGMADSIKLLPALEVIPDKAARERMLSVTDKLLSEAGDAAVKEKLERERGVILSGGTVDFRDRHLGLIYKAPETLLDYLARRGRCPVFVVGTSGTLEELTKYSEYMEGERKALLDGGLATADGAKYVAPVSKYSAFLAKNTVVHINAFAGGVGSLKLSGLFGFRCRRTVSYGNNPRLLHEDLTAYRRGLYRTLIVTDSRAGAEALAESLRSADFAPVPVYDNPDFDIAKAPGGGIYITVGETEGYDLISTKIAVLSMAREEGRAIMSERRRRRIIRNAGGAGKQLMSYAELSEGDYVVHASYGIGLFVGIETVTVDGVTKDYITIKYAGTDKLFVPCDRLEMIGKYIGERDKDGKVKLSKMGGTEWHRAKSRAKGAARDIAKKLIEIYAERQRKPGFSFPEDSELEYSFADAFEYELTDSQATAVREISADMIRPVPMNRLLCGDVGFGKTEVALRAAFKAIMGGKQVAILVPTTILALQHFGTALSRMNGFPVTVEMLSRFRKPKEQAEILRRVKRGEVDILIGTHKLLSKSLEFRDLGLLIIDEEQRFGVSQKEKLKELAKNVDTLTLTATPIPRTLNMAMNGISDISILDEAPGERRPVQTYVLEHDDTVIFDALRRELARGGQVLYLYNKVDDIFIVADRISKELPDARVAYAHGQMEKEELEDIWQSLVHGEIDILVCTTIIETGVDLPMANTLVIENADRFGLSQLHQIRGRVGRSERQAYAYFTYRPGKALSEVAEKRLKAIKEYAEFGAGFKIALCDLEIRGAGNLLGAEQHGYIESVGYDLYVKILNEAVLEEQGKAMPKRAEALVDIKVNAHIPDYYISTSAQRMEMYKKISLILTPEDASDVTDEFIDRFGEPPRPVVRLIDVALIKAVATEAGIERVEWKGGSLTFVTRAANLAIWSEVFAEFRGMRVAPSGDRIIYRISEGDLTGIAREIMESYYRAMHYNEGEVNNGKK
ncbi:MAG: transcription-repair coupling factor [Clostridia bacterium]|nr:transcription-repair coupling factor [Clostridia bacterium]